MLCGALAASVCSQVMTVLILAAVWILFFGIAMLLRGKTGHSGVMVFFLCMALASGLFAIRMEQEEMQVLPLADQDGTVTARILQVEIRANGKYTYQAESEKVVLEESLSVPFREDFTFILYSDYSLQAQPGDFVKAPVSFYLPTGTDLFDSRRYYRGQNRFLLAYTNASEVPVTPGKQNWIEIITESIQSRLSALYDAHLSKEQSAVLKSMLLGDRSQLGQTLKQRYTDAGAVHLLAISGLHVSILAGCCLVFLRKVPKFIQVPLLLLLVTGFVIVTGSHLSTVRSGIMFGVMLIGNSFHRKGDGINSLGMAAFFIVFSNVYAIMDIGFCMSFCATLGLLVFAPGLQRRLELCFHAKNRVFRWGLGVLSVSLSANLLLIPIFILEFGCISLAGPLVNLPLSLTAPVILVFGLIISVIGAFFPVPHFLFSLLGWVIELQNQVVCQIGALPFVVLGLDFPLMQGWLWTSAVLLAMGWLFRRKKGIAWMGGYSAVLFMVLYGITVWLNTPQICVVGDGSRANVILMDGIHASVISMSDDDYIDIATMRYLRRKNVQYLDTLFLGYYQADAIRDTQTLLEIYPPSQVVLSEEAALVPETLMPQADCVLAESVSYVRDGMFLVMPKPQEKQLEFAVTWGTHHVWVGHYRSADQYPHSQWAFVTGYPKQVDIDADAVFLLQRQYNPVAGSNVAAAADQIYELKLD